MPSKTKYGSSTIPTNKDIIKPSSPASDKSSRPQSYSRNSEPDTLSDLASVVRSTSRDGQAMPGHRTRQKASSKLKSKFKERLDL